MPYELIGGAIYFPDRKVLAMADLHLGYEAELRRKGVMIPANEFRMLHKRISRILSKTKPKMVVVCGDFKHSFGTITDAEWRQAVKIMELLTRDSEVILITGNHDIMLGPIARVKGFRTENSWKEADILFMHGDKLPLGEEKGAKTIVIGHQHPAIGISKGARKEVVKCYLVGSWKRRKLIVLPSMFSLSEGSDVLREKIITPFIRQVANLKVFALSGGDILYFGKVSDVRTLG